jgi:catechol 2,3-dioxygenase-like lactoylglutathione lyase family enzyme
MSITGIDKKIVTQVCIIVRDVEKTVARYREIFGFEPQEMQITLAHADVDVTYYGKPTDARAKFTWFNIGQLQFEIMQPLDPQSTWYDHLEKHGEGIHHIAFFVPSTDPAAESFEAEGYTITQQGLFTGKTGKYTYLNTDKDMGVTIELLEVFGLPDPTLQAPPWPADKGIGTDIVNQVGIIISDIETMAQRISDVLGIPKPPIFSTPGHEVVKTMYNGQPCYGTAKLAFFNLGQIQLELIEPDEKPSVWREFLERTGGGAHHIAFPIKDTKRVVEYLAQQGIPVTQQGFYGDLSGMYTYTDSEAQLGTTVELLESFPKQ